jgi:diacylglycerol kinase
MEINPDDYSPQTARNQMESFQFALAGLLFLFRRQHTIRLLSVATLGSILLAVVAKVSLQAIMLMCVAISLVWMTEMFNTALEAIVNLVEPEYHPMAKVGKDVAAAASLLTSFLAITITLVTLVPPLAQAIFA